MSKKYAPPIRLVMRAVTVRTVFLLGAICILFLNSLISASAANESELKNFELPSLDIDRDEEGWIAHEIRRNKAFPHLDMAFRKERKGDLEGALQELEAYMEIDPKDDNVLLHRITMLNRLGHYQQALDSLNKVIERHPGYPTLFVYGAELNRRLGQIESAQDYLETALSMNNLLTKSQANEIHLSLADLALANKDYARALRELDALTLRTTSFRTRMTKGLALSGLGRHEESLKLFLDIGYAADTKDQRVRALSAAAEESIALNQLNEALNLLEKIQHLADSSSAISMRLGHLSLELENIDTAARYYNEAWENGGDTHALRALINALLAIKRFEEAREYANIWVRNANSVTERAEAYVTLGTIAEQQRDYAETAHAFAKALRLQPSAETYLALGRVYSRLKRYRAAREAYERSLALAPLAETQYELVMLLAKEGSVTQAASLLQKAVTQGLDGEDVARGWKQIGLSALAKGNIELSANALARAKRMLSKDREIRMAQADVELNREQYGRAAKRYQDLLEFEKQRGVSSDILKDLYRKIATSWNLAGNTTKSIYAYKKLLQLQNLTLREQAEIMLSVSHLLRKSNRHEAANRLLLRVANMKVLAKRQQESILRDIANRYLALGKSDKAEVMLERALRTGITPGPERATMLQNLAQLKMECDPAAAEPLLREALSQPNLSEETRVTLHSGLGYLALSRGNPSISEKAFRQGLQEYDDNMELQLGLGQAIFLQDKFEEAKTLYTELLADYPMPRTQVALSQVYGELGQPGLALHYMRQAEGSFDSLERKKKKIVYKQMGYYLEALHQYNKSLAWYEKARSLEYDTKLSIQSARVLLKLKRTSDAAKIIDDIHLAEQDTGDRVQLLVMKARIALSQKKYAQARHLFEKAIALSEQGDIKINNVEKANLWKEVGGIAAITENHQEAAEAYARSLKLEPIPTYMMALGYQEIALKNLEKARELIATAVTDEPDFIDAQEDLAYVIMQLHDNDAAVEQFKRAIDLAPIRRATSDTEEILRTVHRMRSEVRSLNNNFDTDLYLTFTSGETGSIGDSPSFSQDMLRSESGFQVAWTPPHIGFRDHRVMSLIGRLSWLFKPETLNVEDDSLAAAIGVHYKPFKDYNFKLGLEKLSGIGENAEDQAVFRTLGAVSDGIGLKPTGKFWNYSHLFSEFDTYLENVQRVTGYIEGRQGFTWRASHNLTITPFLVADARLWSDSKAKDLSFYEGGIGASCRFYYDEEKYELPHRWVELLISYKTGHVFGHENIVGDEIDAFFLTMSFHF